VWDDLIVEEGKEGGVGGGGGGGLGVKKNILQGIPAPKK